MGEIIDSIKNRPDLVINRLPQKTRQDFIKFADEEYCSDYGFALKHLFDFYTGVLNVGNEHLEAELNTLREEVLMLKMHIKNKEEKENNPRRNIVGEIRK